MKFAQYYVPSIVTFGIISACYTNLAFTICIRRDSGQLKRMRGTPLAPVNYLGGIFGSVILIALILTALVTALGILVYGVTFPGHYLAMALAIIAGAFCFGAIGVAVSTVVPNEDAAPAIINFIIFPLLFISGTFGTVSDTSAVGRIANVFPVRHLLKAMVKVFSPFEAGNAIGWSHLAVLVAWAVVGTLIAVRRFRWEPNRK